MEPKQSSPEFSLPNPESIPGNTRPEIVVGGTETAIEQQGSSAPERAPEQAAHAQASMAAQAVPITLPTPVIAPPIDQIQPVSDDSSPAVAADEDLIEKEWVDKAKQIISSTRDDPARREKEVGRLQADYLKKRYGKELGTASE